MKKTESFQTFAVQGMSLRDYFAIRALQGMLSNSNSDGYKWEYSQWAYQYADEMIKARDK